MVRLNWTIQAQNDLIKIAEYIAKDSIKYSKIQIKRLRDRTKILKSQPLSGHVVPELNNEMIRELIIGNYRIIYIIIDKSRIDILTVYHSARLLNEKNIK